MQSKNQLLDSHTHTHKKRIKVKSFIECQCLFSPFPSLYRDAYKNNV